MTFAPAAVTLPTLQTATLNVVAAGVATTRVALTGTGVIPSYRLTPGPGVGHNYGNQEVGTSSAPFQFTLTNTGSVPAGGEVWLNGNPLLTGTFASQFAAAFRAGDTCTATTHLAQGATCTFSVVFAPTSVGSEGTSVFNPGARADVAHVAGAINLGLVGSPVWGAGVQATVGFIWVYGGAVGAWGTATGARSITVRNTGPVGSMLSLTALPAVANLTGGAQFAWTGGTCAAGTVLPRNSACTVIVTRTRPAAAPFAGTGTLTLSDTGAATGSQVLSLSGN